MWAASVVFIVGSETGQQASCAPRLSLLVMSRGRPKHYTGWPLILPVTAAPDVLLLRIK